MDYILLEELIKQKHKKFEEISDKIWEYAESGYKEVNSSALQRQVMSDEGFTVENGIGGITTAFRASFGSGKPVIAFLGEFDALPELSQKADVTYKEPLLEGGYGHGCGHHIFRYSMYAGMCSYKGLSFTKLHFRNCYILWMSSRRGWGRKSLYGSRRLL